MNKTIRVCHVTSVHSSDDGRIFHKECCSLCQAGYEVYLVAPGDSREEKGIKVVGCGEKPQKKYVRATSFAKKVVNKALMLDCDVYHLHDPELLLHVHILKKAGKKVIIDSHEDYYFDHSYFPKPFVGIANRLYYAYEKYIISRIDGLICCYRKTFERLMPWCSNIQMVYNFPLLNVEKEPTRAEDNGFTLGYAGAVSTIWNHSAVVDAIDGIEDVKYILAGPCREMYMSQLKEKKGWEKVDYRGRVPFDTVYSDIYGKASVGIALLKYIRECNGTEGNLSNTKLFEMMYVGLPVIATNFDLWKEVVEENDCGLCVNPYDIDEIRKAIVFLRDHPDRRRVMGINARKAIIEKYNWPNEAQKLLLIYQNLGL